MNDLKITAQINKITTTVDGGWRITFDVGDEESTKIAVLSQLREKLLSLNIEVFDDEFSS